MTTAGTCLLAAIALTTAVRAQDEPDLPAGLNPAQQPGTAEAPELPIFNPPGDAFPDDSFAEPELTNLRGFLDLRSGYRTHHDPDQSRFSLGELRLQTEWSPTFEGFEASVRIDWLADAVAVDPKVLPDDGHGWIDVREGYVRSAHLSWLEVTAGRQILTWGTGDLIFLNDLFPKDFSFFLGRDAEYLKAPSDALKVSAYSDLVNIDFVWSPWFDPDRFPDGTRQSIFNPFVPGTAGRSNVLPRTEPDFGEFAARLTRNFESIECALYGYRGYWKSPQGLDFANSRAFFPRMNAIGGSVRGPQFGGITNFEFTYYDSVSDRVGSDPFLANSRTSILLGHERSIATDLTLGLQYLLEWTDDHGALKRAAPPGFPVVDEYRQLYTTRLTWLTHRQKARWSLFWMHSPTDEEFFVRPSVTYDYSDRIKLEVGANVLEGQRNFTPLGQLERSSNVYVALRYSF